MKNIIFVLLFLHILVLGAEVSSDSLAPETPLAFIQQLGDKDALTRRRAAFTLEEKGVVIAPALIDALKNDNEYVRYYAAFILGRIGESSKEALPIFREAVPALIEAMNTKGEIVSYGAINALKQIGTPEAIKAVGGLYYSNWYISPLKWKEPRICHAPYDSKFTYNINLDVSKLPDDSKFAHSINLDVSKLPDDLKDQIFSPNRVYWYIAKFPDTTKPGPWSTVIQIYNERDYCIQLSLIDHKYIPKVSWINEKLLHIRVWWGRILGSEFIYDVEHEQFIYKEMFFDVDVK